MIADDFTGALDSGVQFSARGASVKVLSDADYKTIPDVDVLVINAESRHMTAERAYQTVLEIAHRALAEGAQHIYKKTDSALRGNIGAELSAVMDAAGETQLPFIPAFPKMKRITRNGVHYINELPVSESAFGKDPFAPVRESEVKKLIRLQTQQEVNLCPACGSSDESGIQVYDAESDEDLDRIADTLVQRRFRISAGCAGFGSALARVLGFHGKSKTVCIQSDKLFMICGSVHPVTVAQIKRGVRSGAARVSMCAAQLLEHWDDAFIEEVVALSNSHDCCILDTDPERAELAARYAKECGIPRAGLRDRIAESLGRVTKELLDDGLRSTLLCCGGDTLRAVVKELGIRELDPLYEILPGVILTQFQYNGKHYDVITKSGGFGEVDILSQLMMFLKKTKEKGYAEKL